MLMSLFCGYLVCMVVSDRGFQSLKYHLMNGLEESRLLLPHFSAADGEIGVDLSVCPADEEGTLCGSSFPPLLSPFLSPISLWTGVNEGFDPPK